MSAIKLAWVLFAFFAIAVGLYPITFFIFDMTSAGLLSTKPSALLQNALWKTFFYLHILFGGAALLTGWSQFSQRIRNKNINVHRTLGKSYIVCVLLSGSAGLYIAFYSTGGMITHFGFGTLACLWLYTTIKAYSTIKKRMILRHQNWMVRSYALCFAAVTLRLWLPLFQFLLHVEFERSYRIISWLSWVPNLLVAEAIVRMNVRKDASITLAEAN